MTTPDWMAAIRARCAAATKGPWQVCPDENTDGDLSLVCLGQGDEHGGPICTHPLTPDDATFIAHSRADVPALLDLVEALAGALIGETETNGWCHTCEVPTDEPEHAHHDVAACPVALALARYAAGPRA